MLGAVQACGTGGANLVMIANPDEAQKEAAWQFVNWMTQTDQAVKASMTTGYLPTRISAVEDAAMQATFESIPEFKVAINQLAHAGGRTVTNTEANAEIVSAIDSIWVNNQDIDETLAQLETKVNSILTAE